MNILTSMSPVVPAELWHPRAHELVDELLASGALRSPVWREAFTRVPRHAFVPVIYRRDEHGELRAVDGRDPALCAAWLRDVYSDDSLITQLAQVRPGYALRPFTVPASSSTRPSLMARMLEDLELTDGMRVLEIGTGTGYNAALLAHRLGSDRVSSVDIHAGLVRAARARLAGLGFPVRLTSADGTTGWSAHAPYDRIIATCGVTTVPTAWIEQTRPGGIIISDVLAAGSGALVRLRVDTDGTASGSFLDYPGLFMAARDSADHIPRQPELTPDQLHGVRETSTLLCPEELADSAFRFFLQLHLGTGRSDHYRTDEGDNASVVADDGSWAETTFRGGATLVRYEGTHNPWELVEQVHKTWCRLGRPALAELGLTVTPRDQYVWHRTADSAWTHHLTQHADHCD